MYIVLALGAVHKLCLQEEGGRWSKKLTFCKLLHYSKCKRRGVGGQKKTNLVNVVCERPLKEIFCEYAYYGISGCGVFKAGIQS